MAKPLPEEAETISLGWLTGGALFFGGLFLFSTSTGGVFGVASGGVLPSRSAM